MVFAPLSARAATGFTHGNGISFSWSGDLESGTFVDGMPWVVEPSPGAGVTITSMSPAYSGGRHGYAVNPTTLELTQGQFGCNKTQCDMVQIDSRAQSGGSNPTRIFVAPTTTHPLPYDAQVGDSILKVESYTGAGDCWRGTGGAPSRTCIDHSAVLTVLASAPAANSFRPPYPGTSKPIFSASSVDIDAKLPTLGDVAAQQTIAYAEAIFGDGSVWIHHIEGDQGTGRLMPRFGTLMPGGGETAEYGCDGGIAINHGLLRSTQSGTAAQKQNLVYRLIQLGIDLFYANQNGKTWWSRGCVTMGRKTAQLYAGYMLSPQSGSSIFLTTPQLGQEDAQTSMGATEAVWGNDPCNTTPSNSCSDTSKTCDGLRDGGLWRYGPGAPSCSTGTGVFQPTLASIRSSGNWSFSAYQRYTAPWYGSAAVARILDLEDEWNNQAFFDYVDRLNTAPWAGICSGHCGTDWPYPYQMFDAYGEGVAPGFSVSVSCDPPSGDEPLDSACTAVPNNEQGTVSYAWEDDDGSCQITGSEAWNDGTGNPLNLVDLAQGTYYIKVQATDDFDSSTDESCVQITVNAPAASPQVEEWHMLSDDPDEDLGIISPGSSWPLGDGPYCVWPKTNVGCQSIRQSWTPPGGTKLVGIKFEMNQPYAFEGEQGWLQTDVLPNCRTSLLDTNSNTTFDMQEVGEHTLFITCCAADDADEGCTGGFETEQSITFTLTGSSAVCGNGSIEGTEQCDDGDLSQGDGCNPDCNIEFGWGCSGEPSHCGLVPASPGFIIRGEAPKETMHADSTDSPRAVAAAR